MPERVLILAPRGRDAAIAAELLGRHDIRTIICANQAALLDHLNTGAGAVMLTEEALLAGDIEQPQEAALAARSATGALRADVLLVPHHGSRTSSSPALLDAVRPRLALAQAGYRIGDRVVRAAKVTVLGPED